MLILSSIHAHVIEFICVLDPRHACGSRLSVFQFNLITICAGQLTTHPQKYEIAEIMHKPLILQGAKPRHKHVYIHYACANASTCVDLICLLPIKDINAILLMRLQKASQQRRNGEVKTTQPATFADMLSRQWGNPSQSMPLGRATTVRREFLSFVPRSNWMCNCVHM